MVFVVCAGFQAQILVDQVPQGGHSKAKSVGGSPDRLSGVVLDELGQPPRFRTFGQSEVGQISEPPPDCSQTAAGLDPLDSPQSDAAVQRHLHMRLPGSRRGAQMLHDNLLPRQTVFSVDNP